jgi:uncharacterized coiled-coil DUF342 family protein
MESEKVKEIKEDIEICTSRIECKECSLMPIMKSTNCRNELLKNCLTLINELESENDTLHTNLCEWRKENQQLKDRIAEMQKEKEETTKAWLEDREGMFWDGVGEGELKGYEQLKQFAEILKKNITVWYPSVIESIDQTLKEFIK